MRKRGEGGGEMVDALGVSDVSSVVKCRGCVLEVDDGVSSIGKCRGCTLGVGNGSSVNKCQEFTLGVGDGSSVSKDRGCALGIGHGSLIRKCRGCTLRDIFLNMQFNTSKRTLKAVRREGNPMAREEARVVTGNRRTKPGRPHPPEGNPTVREETGVGDGDPVA
jgi:hypothetical protein